MYWLSLGGAWERSGGYTLPLVKSVVKIAHLPVGGDHQLVKIQRMVFDIRDVHFQNQIFIRPFQSQVVCYECIEFHQDSKVTRILGVDFTHARHLQ